MEKNIVVRVTKLFLKSHLVCSLNTHRLGVLFRKGAHIDNKEKYFMKITFHKKL